MKRGIALEIRKDIQKISGKMTILDIKNFRTYIQNKIRKTLFEKKYLELHIERTPCLPENIISDINLDKSTKWLRRAKLALYQKYNTFKSICGGKRAKDFISNKTDFYRNHCSDIRNMQEFRKHTSLEHLLRSGLENMLRQGK